MADPEPKRYEMSAIEKELVELMEKEGSLDIVDEPSSPKTKLPQMPADHKLPPDLRMDEYSSDEEDNDAAIGDLLIGRSSEVPEDLMPNDEEDNSNGEVDDDYHSESDDDLRDVPDTREFEPTDVGALEAMGLGQGGEFMDDEDDPSEAEDVRLTADDVLMVVAKTEDVSLALVSHECAFFLLFSHNEGFRFAGSSSIRPGYRERVRPSRYPPTIFSPLCRTWSSKFRWHNWELLCCRNLLAWNRDMEFGRIERLGTYMCAWW